MKNPVYSGFPAGANNLAPDHALPRDKYGRVIHARSIVNADVLDDGKLRRRKGFTALVEGASMQGATSYAGAIHYVDGGVLKRIDGAATAVLREGLALRPMNFQALNGDLYFTNGADTGLLRGGDVLSWGVEAVDGPPVITPTVGGLPSGDYQVLCTFVRADGEEGGCGPAALFTGTGFALVAPTSLVNTGVNVYVAGPNDDVFRRVGTVLPGAYVVFDSVLAAGPELRTRYLRPMPAGDAVVYYRGRLYVASGNVLWYSDPMFYGLCDVAKNFLLFPGDITALVAGSDGLFVGADQLYQLTGKGPGEFEQSVALTARVAARSSAAFPDGTGELVITDRGLAKLGDDGKVEVFDQTVSTGPATAGASLVREQDGIRQLVGVAYQPAHVSGMAASDYMDAEIIRSEA